MKGALAGLGALLALTALPPATVAGEASAAGVHRQAFVAIVIDDIGYRREDGLRALELPGDVSFAVLPHAPHGASIALLAAQLGKAVLVHLPMESLDGHYLGPGGITSEMGRAELQRTVAEAVRSVPRAVGLNNHMGSRLTADRERMRWLMQTLGTQSGALFLDSRTTEHTVAADVAAEYGIRHLSRDVFLDNERDERSIRRQFFELVHRARANGSAVAIGHPFPETIAVLAELIPQLARYGVELVPVTRLREPRRPAAAPSTLQASAQGGDLTRQ